MRFQKMIILLVCVGWALGAPAQGLRYGWSSLKGLEKVAQEGKPAAQADLAQYYLLSEQYDQAFVWFKKAAHNGEAEGFYGLGLCYEKGWCGVEKDLKKAFRFYKKAARKNSPGGLYKTALFLHDGTAGKAQPKKALAYMQRAAEKGSTSAQHFLALSYTEGETQGITQDYQKAAYYWQKLAEKADPTACFNLGYLYYYGYGVPKDLRRAFEWDLCAAQGGLAEGQFQVGQAYLNAEGVAADWAKGLQWLEEAAAQGYGPALEKLKSVSYYVYQGPDVEQETSGRVSSIEELKERAEAGEAAAQYLYGSLCQEKLRPAGQECDPVFWYQKAAAQGLPAAQEKLKDISK